MENYLEIGQIVNTTGLKGFVKVNPFTDNIQRFEELKKVYIEYKNSLEEVEIESVRYNKNQVILKIKGIEDINQAEKYRNCFIKISRKDAVKLPEDSYFIVDLIGLDVYTNSSKYLGKIDDVYSTKSNDIYVVKGEDGKQILLPAIKQVIENIDLNKKQITVNLIEGLV